MPRKRDPNRSWDALRMPRDLQEHPERILGTSRERLRSVSGSPRCAPRAPRDSTKALRNARESTQERLGARRSAQNRFQSTSGSERIEYFPCSMIEKRCRCEFSTISVDFGLSQKDGEPSEVLRLPAKTEVRLFALRIDSLASRNLGKQRKLTPRSSQNHRKRRRGANRAIFSVDFSIPGGLGERPGRPRRAAQAAPAARAARLRVQAASISCHERPSMRALAQPVSAGRPRWVTSL